MPSWDPDLYLSFAEHRARPFRDLVHRLADLGADPDTIVDLGCGPGQLTPILRAQWPAARILGIDSSPQMIERATTASSDPLVSYARADLTDWRPDGPVDLMISNATFQWVPQQRSVITRLREHLAADGWLALSVPHNYQGASHRVLAELADAEPFAPHLRGLPRDRGVSAADYLELLAIDGWTVDAWTTTYLHLLTGENPVHRWISGTGARPFLQALPEPLRQRFDDELADRLQAAYPAEPYGTVLPFERVFAVTCRVG